jgi:hypothetical protein
MATSVEWRALNARGREGARPRHGHVAVVLGGRLHVHAGFSREGTDLHYLEDLIVLDPASLTWKAVRARGRQPCPRAFHTANALGDNRMVLFGGGGKGESEERPTYLNDVWLYKTDGTSWEACSVDGEPPLPRAAHAAVLASHSRAQLVVSGGTDGQETFNDLWLMTIASPRWEQLRTSGERPSARCYHTCALGPSGVLMLFGGRSKAKLSGASAYLLDLTNRHWTAIAPEDGGDAAPRRGRSSHSAVVHHDKVLIFGGKLGPDPDDRSVSP